MQALASITSALLPSAPSCADQCSAYSASGGVCSRQLHIAAMGLWQPQHVCFTMWTAYRRVVLFLARHAGTQKSCASCLRAVQSFHLQPAGCCMSTEAVMAAPFSGSRLQSAGVVQHIRNLSMFLLLAYLPVTCILTNPFPAHTPDNAVTEGYHAGQGWVAQSLCGGTDGGGGVMHTAFCISWKLQMISSATPRVS